MKERLFWMKMKLDEEIKNRKSIINRERERQKNLIKDTRKALEEYKANKLVVKLLLTITIVKKYKNFIDNY